MNNSIKILGLLAIIMVSSLLIFSVNKEISTDNDEKNTSESYQIKALKLPKNLNFAGEKVPVKNQDIRERMDRELLVNTYWQSNGLLMFKRAQKYFPIIEPILKKNGVPDDFKYLAVIESGLTNAKSPAGASGVWQIMKSTGRELGLEINDDIDQRYDIELAAIAACEYLNKAYEKYGNWTLVAASYNLGMGGIENKLGDQKVKSYYDLSLNEETGRYVYRILAIKTLFPIKTLFIAVICT